MTAYGFLAVGVGAALGAWARWILGIFFNHVVPSLPLGTLTALCDRCVGGISRASCRIASRGAAVLDYGLSGWLDDVLDVFGRGSESAIAWPARLVLHPSRKPLRWFAGFDSTGYLHGADAGALTVLRLCG